MNHSHKLKLLQAIEAAVGPGNCRYTVQAPEGLAPGCVIGQLAHLHDVDLEVLKRLDESRLKPNIKYIFSTRYELDCVLVAKALEEYPVDFLRELQKIWDDEELQDDPNLLRFKMETLVNSKTYSD